jgi:hypothetical protein
MSRLSREDMIDEMLEGIAFEDDETIRRALIRFSGMTNQEIREEYEDWIDE